MPVGLIPQQVQRTRQPVHGARLNPRFMERPVAMVRGDMPIELVNGSIFGGTFSVAAGVQGGSAVIPATTGSYSAGSARLPAVSPYKVQAPFTFVLYSTKRSVSASSYALAGCTTGGDGFRFWDLYGINIFGFGVGPARVESSAVWPLNAPSVAVGTYDGTDVTGYLDGALIGTVAGSAPIYDGTFTSFFVGGNIDGASAFDMDLHYAAIDATCWPAAKVEALTRSPWSIFAPAMCPGLAILPTPAITKPSGDSVRGGWSPSDNGPLAAMLSDSAIDTTFIRSPVLDATAKPADMRLPAALAAGSYTVRVRARRTADASSIRVSLLDAGGASVGASAWQALTPSFAQYSIPVTPSGAASFVRVEGASP